MATRKATTVGALLVAAAILPGCVKKVEYKFHIRDYRKTDEVDLFFRVTSDAILGPALSPGDLPRE